MLKLVDLFNDKRFQWGLRGDPYLWDEMQAHFAEVAWPDSADTFHDMLEAAFSDLTGHTIDSENHFFIERFSHGGMSSGMISPQFWRERGLPYLTKRFRVAEWRVEHARELTGDTDID